MEGESNTSTGNKWYGRLALVSAFLFALLWSLGPFFFWMPLALATAFGALALFASGLRFPSFNPPSRPENPYVSYRTPPTAAAPQAEYEGLALAKKVIRFIVIGFVSLLLFLFIVGTFIGNDEDPAAEQPVEITDEPVQNNDANAWIDKGNVSFSQSNYDSALIYYEKALRIDPENQYALYNRALVFSNRQDYRKSNSLARKCLQVHPDYNPAWWLLGFNYDKMNRTDSSLICVEIAYNNNFDEPDFLELMAELYLKTNDREKSIDFYKKVLFKDSTKVSAYKKLAELDLENSDWYRKKARQLESSQ